MEVAGDVGGAACAPGVGGGEALGASPPPTWRLEWGALQAQPMRPLRSRLAWAGRAAPWGPGGSIPVVASSQGGRAGHSEVKTRRCPSGRRCSNSARDPVPGPRLPSDRPEPGPCRLAAGPGLCGAQTSPRAGQMPWTWAWTASVAVGGSRPLRLQRKELVVSDVAAAPHPEGGCGGGPWRTAWRGSSRTLALTGISSSVVPGSCQGLWRDVVLLPEPHPGGSGAEGLPRRLFELGSGDLRKLVGWGRRKQSGSAGGRSMRPPRSVSRLQSSPETGGGAAQALSTCPSASACRRHGASTVSLAAHSSESPSSPRLPRPCWPQAAISPSRLGGSLSRWRVVTLPSFLPSSPGAGHRL